LLTEVLLKSIHVFAITLQSTNPNILDTPQSKSHQRCSNLCSCDHILWPWLR